MVLACDGIWDCFSNDDCVDFVKRRLAKGKTPLEVRNQGLVYHR